MSARRLIDANAMAHIRFVRGADGHLYLHDPQYRLWWVRHTHIPQGPFVPGRYHTDAGGLAGLGTSSIIQNAPIINTALNFIPGVGPILSSIASIAEGIFGGGDPTPIGDIWSNLIQLRTQVAAMRNVLAAAGQGAPDDFTFSGDPNDADTGGVVAAEIASEVLNKFSGEPDDKLRHDIKRTDEYDAIKALQQIAQQLQGAVAQVQQDQHDATLIAAVTGQAAPGSAGAADGTTPPAVDTSAMLSTYGPWALGLGLAVAAVSMITSRGR